MKIRAVVLLLIGGVYVSTVAAEENWPHWRGPYGTGASSATNLPTTWSETENIVWKVKLPSWSGGTPIVWGDRIFITSPSQPIAVSEVAQPQQRGQRGRGSRGRGRSGRGRSGGGAYGSGGRDPGGSELMLLCLSRADGSLLWAQQIGDGNALHRKQNSSSPSPVTDGKHIWTVTGNGSVTAFDMQGTKLWRHNLQQMYGKFGLKWGYASSPVLYEGLVIIEVLHGDQTDDPSYLVAFQGHSGIVAWRHERVTDALGESPDAYTTPMLFDSGGQTELIVTGGDYVTAHNPLTGQELWRASGLNPSRDQNIRIVSSPVAIDGMVYAPTRKTPFLAIRAGGSGNVTGSHTAWTWNGRAAPDVPTPTTDGTFLYIVNDQGIATCLDAKSGEEVWGPARTTGGTVSASPLLADGKLYITNEDGTVAVLAAGGEYRELAVNKLDAGYTLASLAVAGSQIFLRGADYLYCIGQAE